jgi:maltose alpha-D-glucosyltransferase/alpha-amylase
MFIDFEDFLSDLAQNLKPLVKTQRWFGGKSHTIVELQPVDYYAEQDGNQAESFVVLKIELSNTSVQHYLVPLVVKEHRDSSEFELMLRLRHRETEFDVFDGLSVPSFCLKILEHLTKSDTLKTRNGSIAFFDEGDIDSSFHFEEKVVKRVVSEQSNTSVIFDKKYIYKSYRKMSEGANPDYEVPLFLIRNGFLATPKPLGRVMYRGAGYESSQIGSLFSYVENLGDGWNYLTNKIAMFASKLKDDMCADRIRVSEEGNPDSTIVDCAALGELTARLHCSLARDSLSPEFAPEPVSLADVLSWSQNLLHQLQTLFETLSKIGSALPDDTYSLIQRLLANRSSLEKLGHSLESMSEPNFCKIRIHGDYHLGQVLRTPSGFTVIDFEGEPARTIEYRRCKRCAVVDVSGMLRSFGYASSFVAKNLVSKRVNEICPDWPKIWGKMATDAFLGAYWEVSESRSGVYLPSDFVDFNKLVKFFVAEKAVYELGYELNNRPSWAGIPATALMDIVGN